MGLKSKDLLGMKQLTAEEIMDPSAGENVYHRLQAVVFQAGDLGLAGHVVAVP